MKNSYDVSPDGKTVTIWIRRKGEDLACLIDASDLPKAASIDHTWHAQWDPDMSDYYVVSYYRKAGVRHKWYLHRLLMDVPDRLHVGHWNHLTLDNRRANLRIATNSESQMNRQGANWQNPTGCLGIRLYRKAAKPYKVRITIDGKERQIGSFLTLEEAITARNKYPAYDGTSQFHENS